MSPKIMLYYWYRLLRIFISKNFQPELDPRADFSRTFRVRLWDCDGLRVMTAFKYAAYMDFIRWELVARSILFKEIVVKGLAPTLGSQKIVYRKPLKRWTKFKLILHLAGWDEKWLYHVHTFEQQGEVKAVGITRALIWRKDKPQVLEQILRNIGVKEMTHPPPRWVMELFENDAAIIAGSLQ